jgi:GTP-binding protein Era
MADAPKARAGFVALIGAPNAGKSTLINRLVGAKVSIVSPKVQTTRSRVRGIAMHKGAQLVLVDTPGIFKPRRRLDRAMVAAAWDGAGEADLVVLLIDAKRGLDEESQAIIQALKAGGRRALLALNKVDVIDKPKLLALAQQVSGEGEFEAIFMISAETGDGCEALLDHLAAHVPEGPYLYPQDEISDMPERLLAAEIVREQLFRQLHQELPYASTVETEAFQDKPDGSARIDVTIYVQRDSQKAIVLGSKGARIKEIGAKARAELEELMGRRVHLFLFVKVREDWQEDGERYRPWGLDFNAK